MLVIAHRGASGHAPENTLVSFRKALESGARALELDVRQSRDGELVVIHDADLRRVGGRRRRVSEMTAAELARADVGSWFAPRFAGEGVPRLSDVFDLVGARAEVNVELKESFRDSPGIEESLVKLIGSAGAWKRTVVSSFDHEALFAVRAESPKVRIGYLLGRTSVPRAFREMESLRAESLNLSLRQAKKGTVEACHRKGRKVLVYTANTRRELARLERLGVDGAFTNFPELWN